MTQSRTALLRWWYLGGLVWAPAVHALSSVLNSPSVCCFGTLELDPQARVSRGAAQGRAPSSCFWGPLCFPPVVPADSLLQVTRQQWFSAGLHQAQASQWLTFQWLLSDWLPVSLAGAQCIVPACCLWPGPLPSNPLPPGHHSQAPFTRIGYQPEGRGPSQFAPVQTPANSVPLLWGLLSCLFWHH